MSPQVLIAGAGPTGLTAAAELKRLGVSVRIIDKNSTRTDKSKALGVQAGTLEALAATLGESFSETLVQAGLPCRTAVLHLFEAAPVRVDLSRIPSRFDFVLILPQSETERLLEEKLGAGIVERNTELVSFRQTGKKVVATIRANGSESEVEADFIIGADGAHSVVRHQLELPLSGGQYQGEFILGDVLVDWNLERGIVHSFVNSRGLMVAFPIDKTERYRLILSPRESTTNASPDISLEEFTKLASHIVSEKMTIHDPQWLTRFSVHHRLTQHFHVGRAFLAGDAAHIHSPVGGQGMNTGIQDALNLAGKIARVLCDGAPLSSLDDYERERLPIAKKIVRGTDMITQMGLLSDNTVSRFMRARIAPMLVRNKFLQKTVITAMSQVRIARAGSRFLTP
jgi:2-polyprenyl-6-methoxyphenol hydroxylase-like FAD-dependent oxidoreductase